MLFWFITFTLTLLFNGYLGWTSIKSSLLTEETSLIFKNWLWTLLFMGLCLLSLGFQFYVNTTFLTSYYFIGAMAFVCACLLPVILSAHFLFFGSLFVIKDGFIGLRSADRGPLHIEEVEEYFKAGKFLLAEELLMPLLAKYPDNEYINRSLLQVYEQNGENGKAIDCIRRLLKEAKDEGERRELLEKAESIDAFKANRLKSDIGPEI